MDRTYMNSWLIGSLRGLLVLVFLGVVGAQVLAPVQISAMAAPYAEARPLALPYSVVAVVLLLFVEVSTVGIWRLLTMAQLGRVFDPGALRWVDLVTISVLSASLLAAAAFGYLAFGASIGGPLMPLGFIGCLIGGATLVLLLVVMRKLLESAISARQDLAEVI